jgi:glycosyltransferase involved in cell wall biosynthesis
VRINLISRDNGVGLTTDMELLEGILGPAGHDVVRVPWRSRAMRRCEVAVFLELFNPALLPYAAKTVGIFNLEWFEARWRPWLPRLRQLWAKSGEAEATMRQWGLRNVHHTGFAGRDMLDETVPRELRCIHLAGHSSLKGTEQVIQAWRDDPGLPELTIISERDWDAPAHVRVLTGHVAEADKRRELNAAAIHVCPSRSEGWGHYITEALSMRATVVTTDASPMNEHVRPEFGVLVPSAVAGRRNFADDHAVTAPAVAEAVRRAAAMSEQERAVLGDLGRAHVLARTQRFADTALALLRRL